MTLPAVEPNPLLEGLQLRRRPEPCALVIFGASGDLTQRKLMPALYSLAFRRLLPERFAIVGAARSKESDDEFRERMKEAVQQHARDEFRQDVWDELAAGMRYCTLDFGDDLGENDLIDLLTEVDAERGTEGNRVFYFAVPPSAISLLVQKIAVRRTGKGWTRLIIEKPFGHDLASARSLNSLLTEHFDESEVFRIDHYLGKETVQNLLALRFANGIFEPIWNRQFIDHVQITVAESIGIEGRAAFYEQAGAMRDIFQNHLLQLVAITAMEPPIDFTADSVRNEKVKVLRALHTPGPKSVVRGQYGRGFIEGEEVPGYREEDGVAQDSTVETFVAAKLYVDNWRWADTPFYVRMGKRLARRETTIAIQFKRAPHPPFEEAAAEGLRPNVLLIHVQPNEGMSLAIGAKVPGQGMSIRTVHMDFLYGSAFREGLPEAYERLILDAMLGDATLFTRADEVEEQWALVDAIVAAWQRDRPTFPNYAAGTWGPPSADDLLHRDGRSWRSALSWPNAPAARRGLVGQGCLDRRHRRRARAVARRLERGGAPAAPAHERDDARRLGAAGVAGRRGADAGGDGRAAPVAHRDPRFEAGRGGWDRRRAVDSVLPDREIVTICGEVDRPEPSRRPVARAPASLVLPLVISDLPVFLRWRGEPPFGETQWEQLVDVADRVVVDSSEWDELRYRGAHRDVLRARPCPDIAWARTHPWRVELAGYWPAIREQEIWIRGPRAEATLLAGWLSARLRPCDQADRARGRAGRATGRRAAGAPQTARSSPSDLLSAELDHFSRDRIYEEAVAAAS